MSGSKSLAKIDDPIIQDLLLDYDEDILNEIELTDKEIKKLRTFASRISYGDSSMAVLICSGPVCAYRNVCLLQKVNKAPIGTKCPFESFAVKKWTDDYVRSLNINMQDKVERSLVSQLVECDILNSRANAVLGSEGFIMENVVGIDATTGDPLYRKEEHIAMSIKEKTQARKDKLLKSFLATRESKMKVMKTIVEDPTEYMAKLRKKFEEIQSQHSTIINGKITEKQSEDVAQTDPF